MNADKTYLELPKHGSEISHAYGNNVHIVADTFLLTKLAALCSEATIQPTINAIVGDLYQQLIRTVVNGEFPRTIRSFNTRMANTSPYGVWTGEVVDPETPTVTVNILRAGILPSLICFDHLNKIMNPTLVRQDHVVMSRLTDEHGRVTGSHLGDSKIGGSVEGAIVLFPDPMGATGGSMSEVIQYYKNTVEGMPKKIITVNLIVTPEYLRTMHARHPDVTIYALRIDRGGSSPEVLRERPGVRWNEETGLTDKQYIVPGGGGFGEIINNSYC